MNLQDAPFIADSRKAACRETDSRIVELHVLGDLPGEEALSQRSLGHETDPEFFADVLTGKRPGLFKAL